MSTNSDSLKNKVFIGMSTIQAEYDISDYFLLIFIQTSFNLTSPVI